MHSPLTHREVQILRLIAAGLTNKEISDHLAISESTVENHIHHVYQKLEILNRAQAVGYAYQSGLIVTQQNEGKKLGRSHIIV